MKATKRILKKLRAGEIKAINDYGKVGFTGIRADEMGHDRILKGLMHRTKK